MGRGGRVLVLVVGGEINDHGVRRQKCQTVFTEAHYFETHKDTNHSGRQPTSSHSCTVAFFSFCLGDLVLMNLIY